MPEYRREQLADLAGVSVRTIRYYHSIGVLAKPRRAGKEVVYDDEHLARLRDIATMRGRGLRLDAIRDVLDAAADPYGETDWRALFDPREPRDRHRDVQLDDHQLARLLGDRREEVLADLLAAGYLEPHETRWRIPDSPMLRGALLLYDLGVDIAVSAALQRQIRSRMTALADEVLATVVAAAGEGVAGDASRAELAPFLDRFRAAAWEVGGATFADEIERAILGL